MWYIRKSSGPSLGGHWGEDFKSSRHPYPLAPSSTLCFELPKLGAYFLISWVSRWHAKSLPRELSSSTNSRLYKLIALNKDLNNFLWMSSFLEHFVQRTSLKCLHVPFNFRPRVNAWMYVKCTPKMANNHSFYTVSLEVYLNLEISSTFALLKNISNSSIRSNTLYLYKASIAISKVKSEHFHSLLTTALKHLRLYETPARIS